MNRLEKLSTLRINPAQRISFKYQKGMLRILRFFRAEGGDVVTAGLFFIICVLAIGFGIVQFIRLS